MISDKSSTVIDVKQKALESEKTPLRSSISTTATSSDAGANHGSGVVQIKDPREEGGEEERVSGESPLESCLHKVHMISGSSQTLSLFFCTIRRRVPPIDKHKLQFHERVSERARE